MLILALLMSLLLPSDSTGGLPHYPAPVDTVRVEGTRLAYYDSGGTGAVVLFVHGLGSNLSFWRENLGAFDGEYRVLALDLPGYGLSEKDDVPGTMTHFAHTIASFLDALGVETVHYVGVSMGGQIGMTFALEHPERLGKLVLVSPAGIETFAEQEAALLKSLFTPEAVMQTPNEIYRQNVANNFSTWDEARFGWLLEQREAVKARADFPGYAEANARSVAGMLDGPVFSRLSEIDAPTLVLFGANDKLIPNPFLHPGLTTADVAHAAEAIPNADVRLIDAAGHVLMIERPDVFNAAVRAFLEKE